MNDPFAWLLFFGMGRTCPDCNRPLSPFQSPWTKTKRQWIEGGYVCQNCGCEVNIYGGKVAAGTPPKRQSIVLGIGLVTLAVLGIVLLAMLFWR
jgi:hypothetical protein